MPAFAQNRTGQRARRLALSQLMCVGRHTVTGLLYTCGRQFVDWSGDYRLFSQDRWEGQDLFAPVIDGVLQLLPQEMPVLAAMDDTRLHKTGTKIPGVGYGRDPLSPPFHVNFVRGQRFLQVSALLPDGPLPGGARAIPVRYEHVPPATKPGKSAPPEVWKAYRLKQRTTNLSTRGAEALRQLRQELDERHGAGQRAMAVSVDGGYTNQTVLKHMPDRTIIIGRIRKDAELYYPPCAADQPAVGHKRQYGKLAPTPEALRLDEAVPWQLVPAFAAGKEHNFRIKTLAPVLWKKAGPTCPLRLLVIAPVGYRLSKGSKILYRLPAYLICTDCGLPLPDLLQYYLWRWGIEVNHRDEKQIIGVGEGQVRSAASVERQPALAVASYAILLLAAAQVYRAGRAEGTLPLPKWQTKRDDQRLSTAELIRQLRSEVWAHALDLLCGNFDPFVTAPEAITKCPESQLPAASSLLYAAGG